MTEVELVEAIRGAFHGWFTAAELLQVIPPDQLPTNIRWSLEECGTTSACISMGMLLTTVPAVRQVRVRGRRAWKLRAQ